MDKNIVHSLKAAQLEFKEEPMDDYYNSRLAGYPSRLRVKKILKELGNLSGKNILDVGCEAGYVSLKILEKNPRQLCAIDICQEAIDKFKQKLKNKKFKSEIILKKAYMQDLPFKANSFDAIVCTEVIEHAPNLPKCFLELSRVMKPGGKLIVTFPNEKLRKLVYPIVKLFGINTDVEDEVTLFQYKIKNILTLLGKSFKIEKTKSFPLLFPMTCLIVCKKTGEKKNAS